MTHAELVARVQRWLRNTRRHSVVLAEMPGQSESPDLIAWTNGAACTLVECKVSRADFLRDQKKWFRREGGLGEWRWYATPPGLVKLAELPIRWGLVEVGPRFVRMVRKPMHYGSLERNVDGERRILVSALRRVTEGWGRKVFGEISPMHGKLDPHPSASALIKQLAADNRALRAKLSRRDETIERLQRP